MDTRSVSQIANSVVHPVETNWRSAQVVIFGRFVPRSECGNTGQIRERDEDRFKDNCTAPQVKDLEWGQDTAKPFLLKCFICANRRKEIVAITEVPSYFGDFYPVGTRGFGS